MLSSRGSDNQMNNATTMTYTVVKTNNCKQHGITGSFGVWGDNINASFSYVAGYNERSIHHHHCSCRCEVQVGAK